MRLRFRPLLVTALAVIACADAATAVAAPGDLDPSFAGDGRAEIADSFDRPEDVAVAPDGTVFAATSVYGSGYDLGVAALTDAGGTAAFGDGGMAGIPSAGAEFGRAVAVDADNRPLVAGADYFAADGKSLVSVAAGRLTPTGAVDASFAPVFDGSLFAAPFGVAGDWPVMAVDSTGRVLVAKLAPDRRDFVVARLLADGALDPAFSGDGIAYLTMPAVDSGAGVAGLAIGPGDTIIVAGLTGSGAGFPRIAVGRLTAAGEPDPGFGAAGVALLGTSSTMPTGVAVDGAGNVFLSELYTKSTHTIVGAVVGLTAAGSEQSGFGLALGKAGTLEDLTVDAAGRVVAVGSTKGDLLVTRFLADGKPDKSFSKDGSATADLRGKYDTATAVAIDAGGRILVAGAKVQPGFRSSSYDPLVARYLVSAGPANADADPFLDKKDACPNVYGPKKPGCPRIKRRVRLKTGRGRVSGKVSGYGACHDRVRVRIYGEGAGPRSIVAKTRTDRDGKFETKVAGPQDVEALAPNLIAPSAGFCLGAVSKAVHVR